MKKNFLLVILSITFSLILIETFLNLPELFVKSEKNKNFHLNKFEFYISKKKENDVSIAMPGLYRLSSKYFKKLLPLGQSSNSEIIHCNENGYFSSYMSNNFGFNSREDESNIVLIGDSYVEGACVNYKDTIVGNLEKLSKKNLNNLGISGTSILYQYSILREYLDDNARVFLFFYEKNDLRELRSEIKNSILIKYLENQSFTQNLKNKKIEINSLLKKYVEEEVEREIYLQKKLKSKIKKIIIHNKFLHFFSLPKIRNIIKTIVNKKSYQNLHNYSDKDFDNYEMVLKKNNEFIKKKGGELTIIYLPSIERIVGYAINMDNIHIRMINMFEKNKIKYFDLTEAIKNNQMPENLYAFEINYSKIFNKKMFQHFNEEGYKFISDLIYEKFKDKF